MVMDNGCGLFKKALHFVTHTGSTDFPTTLVVIIIIHNHNMIPNINYVLLVNNLRLNIVINVKLKIFIDLFI